MYADQQAKMEGAGTSGRSTAVWFANENDRLIKNLTELVADRLAKVLVPVPPQNATSEQAIASAGSELAQQLRDQNDRLETLTAMILRVDL